LVNSGDRHDKQLKEIEEKGYFVLADGTKSSDYEVPAKKKTSKSEKKPAGKRSSALDKSMKGGKRDKTPAKKAAAKTKKSADELDIESEEGSGVHESD